MIICCDWDQIINNLIPKALEMYNEKVGKSILVDNITTYNLYDCLDKEDADGVMKLFETKALWDSLTPIDGSQKGLKKLIDAGNKVYLATATAPENFMWKIKWLKKYFPFFNTDNVIRIIDKSLLKTDVLIEDNLEQLINHKMCDRICLDYPWNCQRETQDLIYSIYRCKNWSEILDAINQIDKENKQYGQSKV